ncbi:hypothetical protein GCM10009591_22490 [Brachybacterium tyrofermentans]
MVAIGSWFPGRWDGVHGVVARTVRPCLHRRRRVSMECVLESHRVPGSLDCGCRLEFALQRSAHVIRAHLLQSPQNAIAHGPGDVLVHR